MRAYTFRLPECRLSRIAHMEHLEDSIFHRSHPQWETTPREYAYLLSQTGSLDMPAF